MIYEQIPGWTDEHIFGCYDRAIERASDGAMFVEIGVAFGRSVAYAAEKIFASGKDITILAVDPWLVTDWQEPEFTKRIRDAGSFYAAFTECMQSLPSPMRSVIHPRQMTSVELAKSVLDKSIDFVFVDGDHSYDSVRTDIDAWIPKVVGGGAMAGHDFTPSHPGVEKAVREAFGEHAVQYGSCWWRTMP